MRTFINSRVLTTQAANIDNCYHIYFGENAAFKNNYLKFVRFIFSVFLARFLHINKIRLLNCACILSTIIFNF